MTSHNIGTLMKSGATQNGGAYPKVKRRTMEETSKE
jgi:hypothetical protein